MASFHACGFALAFLTFSTFKTAACLHLEDLYVDEARRGRGHGLALLRAIFAFIRGSIPGEFVV